MNFHRPSFSAQAQPWFTAVVLTVLTFIAIVQVAGLRTAVQDDVAQEVEETLNDAVKDWEDKLFLSLRESVDLVAAEPALASQLQNRLRRRWPWFGSLYLWRPPGRGRRSEPSMVFPPRPVVEHSHDLRSQACLSEANTSRDDRGIPASDRARLLLRSCANAPLRVRLYAASEAAQLFEEEGDWARAFRALEAVDPGAGLPLVQAAEQGVPPYRLAANRGHAADLLLKQGRIDAGLDLYLRLGLEITQMDAPSAAAPLQLVEHAALPALRRGKGRRDQVIRLDSALQEARRRVAAYREVVEKLLPAQPDPQPATPLFVRDQYSDDPFLLYVGWLDDDRGAALQLEGRALLTEFLESRQLNRLRRYIVVRDSTGRWVEGSRRGGAVELEVPFGLTFPEYRLGVRRAALDELEARESGRWRVPLFVTITMAALGVLALIAQFRAARQSAALLQRQRDFTTRVTQRAEDTLGRNSGDG